MGLLGRASLVPTGGLTGWTHPFVTWKTIIIYIYHMIRLFSAAFHRCDLANADELPSQLGERPTWLRRVGGHAALIEKYSPPLPAKCTAAPPT